MIVVETGNPVILLLEIVAVAEKSSAEFSTAPCWMILTH